MSVHEQMIEAIATDIERKFNTGHRVFVVDREALARVYWAVADFPEPRIARGDQ